MKKATFHAYQAPQTPASKRQPGFARPPLQFAQGLALHQAGRLIEAARIYQQILALRPDHFDSRHLLGLTYLQRGEHAEALRHIELALKLSADNVLALNHRGVALLELKRFAEALATFDRAVALQPSHAQAHCNRANALKALGRFEEALQGYERALALRPDDAGAHANRADALRELKRFAEAVASCDRALALRPGLAEAHCNRAAALQGLNRFEEALASYNKAIELRPDFAEAYTNRGNTLHDLFRFEEALADHDRALQLRPDFAEAHCNRGNALQELRQFAEAVASYDRALALRPNFPEALCNRGTALKEMGMLAPARANFADAIALRADFAEAHFSSALCLLLTGDLRTGWKEYEWRWRTAQLQSEQRHFAAPQWLGSDEIAGKTILLHAEQGFGDTIQFCRYVPSVAARTGSRGRVILEVQRPLLGLMEPFAGLAQIVARGDPLPGFDLHCPLLSLPLAFDTRLESIPAHTPYLRASETKSRQWRDRLGSCDRLRVGLVWAGDPRKRLPNAHRIDRQRSLSFDRLSPVLEVAGCGFYSLQKGEDAVAQLRGSPLRDRLVDFTDELHDFSDTAALIENLDLVITVDTAVAHLVGALGKPFWLINRFGTCWRWFLDREDSLWYPSARIFRQDQTRDWGPVIARIAGELQDHARRFSTPSRTAALGV